MHAKETSPPLSCSHHQHHHFSICGHELFGQPSLSALVVPAVVLVWCAVKMEVDAREGLVVGNGRSGLSLGRRHTPLEELAAQLGRPKSQNGTSQFYSILAIASQLRASLKWQRNQSL